MARRLLAGCLWRAAGELSNKVAIPSSLVVVRCVCRAGTSGSQ